MKRLLVLVVAAAVAATPVAADAARKPPPKKKTVRTVTWDYKGTAGPSAAGNGVRLCAGPLANCFDLTTAKYETKVTLTVKDASGQKVALQYALDGGYSDGATDLCGTGQIAVTKGSVVNLNTTTNPACPGTPTSGTVTFTITGLK